MSTNTNKKDIVKYWAKRIPETELSVDWADADVRCWRCGYLRCLEKCHIVPNALGGHDAPENLVLLCKKCHKEAPNSNDSEFFWDWLKSSATPFYGTFWILKAIEEFESLYKTNFEKELESVEGFTQKDFNDFLEKEIKNTIVHFGESQLNTSTVVSLFKKYLEEKT